MKTPLESPAWIRAIPVNITPPSLKDNTADVDRLVKGVKKGLKCETVKVDLSLVRTLSHKLRKFDYHIDAVVFEAQCGWHLIDILPSQNKNCVYGLSVDLGSSTAVIRLLDLATQESKDETSFPNPQVEIGADILTRIHYAAQEGGLDHLQRLFQERLNEEIHQIAGKHSILTDSIVGMSLAGNTTMSHLFLGLDPYWICREPYIPVINTLKILKASELNLAINSEAPVLVFPNVGSYFGGDLVAGILASNMTHSSEISVLVDVGTNAEVVIGNRDWLMACAGAAGPALEGGVASMGMTAGPGVIDKVGIDPLTSEFSIHTIEGKPPIGICGSGLIDLVAQLFMAGMIDLRGKYVLEKCRDRLIEVDAVKHLVVVFPEDSGTGQSLTLSQLDIDGLIRSKAAMYTILTTITNTVNIPLDAIRRFNIAGTFGSYIDPRSAITIGMIPDLPIETYIPLGNTSLEGASTALLSAQARDEIFQIRDQITYIELNVNQEFMNLFNAAKFIPHTDSSLFPSVKKY
jgi:uncharacterized 2Fe-2S/4Fe-4S cluster protein (DUF4445 family)